MQEKISEDEKVTYDDRRKILIQKKSQVIKNKSEEEEEAGKDTIKLYSTVNQTMEIEYTEEGIRLTYKNLVNEKKFHEEAIIKTKAKLKDAGEMTPELTKLKEDIDKLTEIARNHKQAADLEVQEERLKEVNKEIKSIEDAIGTRLKL